MSAPMDDITLERALMLRQAACEETVGVDAPDVKLVIFALAGQQFAIHGARIREILAGVDVFFVPGCPPSLEGVVNVRGDIEAVFRPHALLQLPDGEPGRDAAILLGRGEGVTSGLRVDRVIDVVDLPHSAIRPPPATLPDHLSTKVLGVVHFREQTVTLLDLDALFADYALGKG